MAKTHHTGLAGQLAVMAHLAWHGRTVAIPMVDEGTDVVALRRGHGRPYRIQVKTSAAQKTKGAKNSEFKDQDLYKCQFSIPRAQLAEDDGAFYFVLVGYVRNRFRFIVIERTELEILAENNGKTEGSYQPVIYFYRTNGSWTVTQSKYLSKSPFYQYVDNWEPLVRRLK